MKNDFPMSAISDCRYGVHMHFTFYHWNFVYQAQFVD